MSKSWSDQRPYIFYFLFIFALFSSAFLLQPKSVVKNLPENVETVIVPEKPDFASMVDVKEKKESFFDFLQPYVDAENDAIMAQRTKLLGILAKLEMGEELGKRDAAFVSAISEEYEIETVNQQSVSHLRQLLRRVDIIPRSLALAQAANESAWGTSRFAVEGNNYFGQWCYSEGCGIIPTQRRSNAVHEVKSFPTVADSVHAYFMNINTFPSYQKLRRMRQRMRDQGLELDAISLSEGLDSYSERGAEYIEELQSMIHFNDRYERDKV